MALLVLIGLPGSGKTSLATELLKCWPDLNPVLFSFDQLVPLEKQLELVSSNSWKNERREFVAKVEQHLLLNSNKKLVIIDDNNYYKSMRYEFYQLARKHSVGFCQIFMQVSLEVAVKRNEKRIEEKVPKTVIEKMDQKLEIPDPLVNSWETFSFVLQESEKANLEVLKNVVAMAAKNPPKIVPDNSQAREKDRAECCANLVHQCDTMLRKKLNKVMRESDDEKVDKKELAKTLNGIRTELLDNLKTGVVKLPPIDEKNSIETVVNQLFEMKLEEKKNA